MLAELDLPTPNFSGVYQADNGQFIARVKDELDGELGVCKIFAHPQSGAEMKFYDLTIEQCTLVGIRESKGVRRRANYPRRK